jgi:hypothetical protein
MAEPPKSNILLKGILIGAITAFLLVGVVKLAQQRPPGTQDTSKYHYSTLLCDDAFQTEKDYNGTWANNHHDYDDLTHIDIPLKDGCFGGMIKIPHTWTDWRMQLLQETPDAWVSIWYAGTIRSGPITPLLKFNQDPATENWTVFPQSFRLQGKGTLRIFPLNK